MQQTEFDPKVRPQDDFFGYVNNKWLKSNPIPPSETNWGTFHILRDTAWKNVHTIINDITEKPDNELTPDQIRLKNFFLSAFNFASNRAKHLATLQQEIKRLHAVKSSTELANYLGRLHRLGLSPGWSHYVSLDDKNSQMEVLRLHQAGLGMPNRDFYLDKTERMKKNRLAYQNYYLKLGQLLPEFKLDDWKTVYDVEQSLAKASWTDIALRDVHKNYNKMSLVELSEKFPQLDWSAYFTGLGWTDPSDHVVVDQPSFLTASLSLLFEGHLNNTKAYLVWCLARGFSSWIDQACAKASFEFYGRTLAGTTEIKPTWKRAVLVGDSLVIGESLGREYAKCHFPESSKLEVQKLVEDIRSAYHRRIDSLTWLKPSTKQLAHRKLDNLKVFIGYPSVWKDLSKLKFSSENMVGNIICAEQFSNDLDLAKIGKPPLDEDWEMNAQTVNAYHHPNRLEIVFPAAILQPPFYDPNASFATNLGGIGAVIGHEFTHGFDDQGREFDANGNAKPWQSEVEQANFMKLANNIIRQADKFETAPGTFLQGKLVIGEALADVGGLELAVEALATSNSKKKDFEELFVSFARCECGSATEEQLVQLAKIDPHPPSPFRVNCVVCHVEKFYEIYGVTEKDKLYLPPENRARIW